MYKHSLILYVNSIKKHEWMWTSKTKTKKYINTLKFPLDEFYDEIHFKYILSKDEKILVKRLWYIKKSSHFDQKNCRRNLTGLGIVYGYHLTIDIGYKDDLKGPANTITIYWNKISNIKDINDIGNVNDTKLYPLIPDSLKNSLKEKRILVVSYLFWSTAIKEGNINALNYLEKNKFKNLLNKETFAFDELPTESLKWLLERNLLDTDKQLGFTCHHSGTIEKVKLLVPHCSDNFLLNCLDSSIDRFEGDKNSNFFNDNSDNINFIYNYLKNKGHKISQELRDKISNIKIIEKNTVIDLVKPKYTINYDTMFDTLNIKIITDYTTIELNLDNVHIENSYRNLMILYAKANNNKVTRICDIRYNQSYFKIESFYSSATLQYTIYTIDETLSNLILAKFKPNKGLYQTTKAMSKILGLE